MRSGFWCVAIAGVIAGCHPGGAVDADEMGLVLTDYNDEYNFGAASTFILPDKIPVVKGNLADGEEPEFLPPARTATILAAIRQNMTDRGYVEVQEGADLVIPVASVSSTTLVYYCDYWWDYWYWWDYYPEYPGWGGCYYPRAYTYTTGSVLMTMIDGIQEDLKPETAVKAPWAGIVNGVLEGNDGPIDERLKKGIDQAFLQSPYLKAN